MHRELDPQAEMVAELLAGRVEDVASRQDVIGREVQKLLGEERFNLIISRRVECMFLQAAAARDNDHGCRRPLVHQASPYCGYAPASLIRAKRIFCSA